MEANFIIRKPSTTSGSLVYSPEGQPVLEEGDEIVTLEVDVIPPIGAAVFVPIADGLHSGVVQQVVQNLALGKVFIEV